ncbi:hypothetical protein PE067_11030 [Paracoccus sp. DMF-8]|uniref:hypothetical protein n=1 Tax=Paracoccus sp. DMF-8 TaxID=3019445 RepID=UPI0023E80C2B|nr:hypothetical protein [Paracoccus sp. DMF-8]MDF3606629.1 hypothetical protein [Paracoccus sp. DMF-8]
MPDPQSLPNFALIAPGMALTPGPNMIWLISRLICQGPRVGLVSLSGVTAGAIAVFLMRNPAWALFQRWLMGTVLAGLAIRMALDSRR